MLTISLNDWRVVVRRRLHSGLRDIRYLQQKQKGQGRRTYQTEADRAGEPVIFRIALHLRVGEEESHGDQSADDHGAATAPEVAALAHEACEDRRGDGTQVRRRVVLPLLARAQTTELCAASSEVSGQKDVVAAAASVSHAITFNRRNDTYSGYARPIRVHDHQMSAVLMPSFFVANRPFRCSQTSMKENFLLA